MTWEVDWSQRKSLPHPTNRSNGDMVWARNPESPRRSAREWHWTTNATLAHAGVEWQPDPSERRRGPRSPKYPPRLCVECSTEFLPHKGRGGQLAECCSKDCRKARWYRENADHVRTYRTEWWKANKQRHKPQRDAYREAHRIESREKNKRYNTKARRLSRHGLSIEQYHSMLAAQNEVCSICKIPSDKPLHVDHDHVCCPSPTSCGKCVRGLLCWRCNSGLGLFRDSVEHMQSAIAYLNISREEVA